MSVSQVDSLLAEMRAAMAAAQGGKLSNTGSAASAGNAASGADFANALKASLDSVAQSQHKAEDLQKAFMLGDNKVSLSDVMIQMQKAGIEFQAAVQVRNKVVAAYNDIMNMQV